MASILCGSLISALYGLICYDKATSRDYVAAGIAAIGSAAFLVVGICAA